MADENQVKFKDDKKKKDPFADVYGTPETPIPATLPSLGLERFTIQDWERRAAEEKAAQDALKRAGASSASDVASRRFYLGEQAVANPVTYGAANQAASNIPASQEIAQAIASTGAGLPDYSAYRAALTDQAQQLNAQIQAMYNQLAGQAGENVGRIQDIYGGATAGIEAGYGSAAENIAQAYQSAQQQAADQMARLGIEEAAGQVLPSQALSQAEAVAGLEAGRAGGLSAAERYGASGAQFGSEMAQVAQQQGTEMNAAILAALQNRLNESLLAEAQGRATASGAASPAAVPALTPYQEAQLAANAQEVGIGLAQWEQEQAQRAQQDLQSNAFRLMEATGISYDEAIARLTGQVPQQSSGGFWDWLTTPLW